MTNISKKLGIEFDNESGEYRTANYKNHYRIVDWYERVIVGRCETLAQAREIARMFDLDTDGECDLSVMKYNPEIGKYECI